MDFFNAIVKAFCSLLYMLWSSATFVLDFIQVGFRKIAGLDTVKYANGVQETDGDLVYNIIRTIFIGDDGHITTQSKTYPVLSTIFWSMMILGAILLFVTTIFAIIRNEYAPDKENKNSKEKIIKLAVKAVFSFLLVPIISFIGLYASNFIVKAIDQITYSADTSTLTELGGFVKYSDSKGKPTYASFHFFDKNLSVPVSNMPLSGVVFRAGCYSANKVRSGSFDQEKIDELKNQFKLDSSTENEVVAQIIDEAFSIGAEHQSLGVFSLQDTQKVDEYYDIASLNYIILVLFLYVILKIFAVISLGLIQRAFELLGLFLIAPAVFAIMPLDSETSFGKWRGLFITRAVSLIGTVLAVNLYYAILPVLQSITFIDVGALQWLMMSVFAISGAMFIKGFTGIMAEIFKVDKIDFNTAKEGEAAYKEVSGDIQTGVSMVKKAGGAMVGAVGLAAKGIEGGVRGAQKIKNQHQYNKEWKEKTKAKNEEQFRQHRNEKFESDWNRDRKEEFLNNRDNEYKKQRDSAWNSSKNDDYKMGADTAWNEYKSSHSGDTSAMSEDEFRKDYDNRKETEFKSNYDKENHDTFNSNYDKDGSKERAFNDEYERANSERKLSSKKDYDNKTEQKLNTKNPFKKVFGEYTRYKMFRPKAERQEFRKTKYDAQIDAMEGRDKRAKIDKSGGFISTMRGIANGSLNIANDLMGNGGKKK